MAEGVRKHVLCPYCCYKFHPNEADFRLTEPTSRPSAGNKTSPGSKSTAAKGKKKSDIGKIIDEKLYLYNLEVLQNTEIESKKNALQYLSVNLKDDSLKYSKDDLEKNGFVQRITYTDHHGKEHSTEDRLCPNCHNVLPIGYGLRDTLLISILGDARSGKSVFLTMLVAELENNPDLLSKLTFIGDKLVKDNFTDNYQKPLLKEHTLISSTKRKKIPPFAFNYWYQYKSEDGTFKENTIDIIFYDIAGEDLRDDSAIRKNGFNIRDSSGLIYLVDPTNFKMLTDLFRFSDNSLIDAIPEDNSNDDIFSTLYNYFIGFEKDKSPIPFAMVLSKSDLFSHVKFDFFNNKPENRIQNMLPNEGHKGALNMRCIKGLNREVRELLTYLNEESVINNALGCFQNIHCFAMSSLGKKPSAEQISDPKTNETVEKGYIDGPPEPFRITEAFYWILMKNGLLYKFENNRYTKTGQPTLEQPTKRTSFWGRIIDLFKGAA
ncbi:MAG: hypothetical protein FWC91_08035 [Defluviitaleaceae bacterium]|nr:hypothetical protein [Defluviitaleaceae bacterium]